LSGGDIIQKLRILLKINFRLALMKPLLLSVGYLLILPMIHGISNLETKYVAELLEKFVSIIGIIVIVPLCSPELNSKSIKESVLGRTCSYGKIIATRLYMAAISLCFLITMFAVTLKILHCKFPLGIYIVGTVITAETIGIVGFLVSLFSNNLILGYIFSIGYVFLCWTGIINEEFPGYLFSMGRNYLQQKGILVLIMIFCIVCSSILLHQKSTNYEIFRISYILNLVERIKPPKDSIY